MLESVDKGHHVYEIHCRGESGSVLGCEMSPSIPASNIRLVKKLDLQPLRIEYPPSSLQSTSKSDQGKAVHS